ncbi:hypothetical protein F8388_008838 [Cannabis sativa]|uniref:NB-ARC domain-containing protein n=1 Tax=Cannabis sativa TaxID=3483 RepID=A0A7J6GW79_CANSA|nr:hypothetical protein F8388_008838 [Cannabis sativa]
MRSNGEDERGIRIMDMSMILKKCRGLPLAIGAIAGLLSRKKKVQSKWEKVLNDIDFEFKINPQLIGSFEILSLSYVDCLSTSNLAYCILELFQKFIHFRKEDCVSYGFSRVLFKEEAEGK